MLMPEPIAGVSGDGYRVRIAEVNGTDRAKCSDDFYLVSSSDVPDVGEPDGPSMVVVEPSSDAVAIAGDTYTVEVGVVFFPAWLLFEFWNTKRQKQMGGLVDDLCEARSTGIMCTVVPADCSASRQYSASHQYSLTINIKSK